MTAISLNKDKIMQQRTATIPWTKDALVSAVNCMINCMIFFPPWKGLKAGDISFMKCTLSFTLTQATS